MEYIEGGELTAAPLRAATAPLFSLLVALRDVAGADRAGTPEPWRRAIRPYLTRRDHEVLAPLVTAGHVLVPNAILPFPDPPGQSLKDGLERIVAGEDDLLRDVESCRALGPTGDWRVPARDPKRWVRGFVLALAHAWRGFGPIWRQRRDRLAAEVQRVQAAADLGAPLELLAGVVPCGWVADDRWVLDGFADGDVRFRAPDRGVTLLPLLAGPHAALVDYDATTLRYVGYPVRGASPVDATLDKASLEALLGGAILVEAVFNIQGIGRYAYTAIVRFDLPVIQGTVLFGAFFIVTMNLLVDIGYALVDPRVRYS